MHSPSTELCLRPAADIVPYQPDALGDIEVDMSPELFATTMAQATGAMAINLYTQVLRQATLMTSTCLSPFAGNYEIAPYGINTIIRRRHPLSRLQKTQLEASVTALQEGWHESDPKQTIDALILELPDTPDSFPASQTRVPPSEPSRLELYFLSKTPNLAGFDAKHEQPGTLAPEESIKCMRDKVRTKVFMQGIAEAITQLDDGSQATIEVCDAGTGAIPVMAIYAALCSDKVRCTALELNPQSAALARQVVERFGLQDRIRIVEANAITYTPEKPIDLLVSETMCAALVNEPIVEIMANLVPHVKPGGVTLPSEITIKSALVAKEDFAKPASYTRIDEAKHAHITPQWQDVVHYTAGQQLDTIDFTLDAAGLPDGEYHVAIANSVAVGSRVLEPYDSLITNPYYARYTTIPNIQKYDLALGRRLAVSYAPGTTLRGAVRQQ